MSIEADLVELGRAVQRFGQTETWPRWRTRWRRPTPPSMPYGAFDDRASWLACARRRAGRSTRIAFRDLRARFIGGVAIVTGVNGVEGLGDLQAGARPDLA